MKITQKQLRQIIREELVRGQLKEFNFPWEDDAPKYEATPFSRFLEKVAETLKANMTSRAGAADDFDPDYLRVVVGPSSNPRHSGQGRTGDSYGDMILRVYFEKGDFPVVKGSRGMGVYNSKTELIDAVNGALSSVGGDAGAPTVKDAQVLGLGWNPDGPQTYAWQITLNPPVTAK
jgi:hypothetical protein